ncbi:MAG: helix-hairpin-helix domain-containing protein [Planctomycetota bacterium]|nr:helix-hairpin-helix domain-containing protein [Planctomycetota bacterium]MDI6786831.1 helix-hairpin-helix domain-containing protein [Planctomycetota bacterium]
MIYTPLQKIILVVLLIILFVISIIPLDTQIPVLFSREQEFFLININTAGADELTIIPYITYPIANQIIEYRERMGGIKDLNELLVIKGIGEKRLERMKKYLKEIGS